MMIKYRAIILLITFTVLFSCIPEDDATFYDLKRTIKNQSGVEVTIISFFYSPDTVAQLTLANGEESTVSASFSIVRGGPPRSSNHRLFETVYSVDSVILVFNNSKFQVHCGFRDHGTKCIAYENDIMFNAFGKVSDYGKYKFIKGDKHDNEWLYTITAEDYENAQDCNDHPRCDY